jgi:hypothetical protein
MTRSRRRCLVVALAMLIAFPAVARAQSAMTGTVKDTSGAVLPGVTVEAASDALIEKSKVAVTDGEGRYLITDLRPGNYVVSFSLTGFSSVRREGITLPSEFTMTLNADLRVGALEESITVTGDAPVVDVTTAAHTSVLNREAIDAIPTGRTIQGMGQLIVGINLNLPDTGGARSMQQTYMSTHGMSTANNTVLVDGMMVNGLQGDGAIQSYFNDAMNQEVSYQTSGIGAETQAGGVRLNMIPREGGNRFSGDFKAAFRPGEWQGSNLTSRHRARNLTAGNATDRIIDFTFAQGGPIKRDRLWFFGSARYYSVDNFIAGTFNDDGSQGVDDQFIKSALLRMTWQITSKSKLSAYFDEVDKYRGHDMQAGDDPETAGTVWYSPAYHTTAAKITNTLSSRLLVEVGWSSNLEYYTNNYQPGIEQPRFSQAWYADVAREEEGIPGYRFTRAADNQVTQSPARYAMNAAVSYVTGSHNFKAGFQRTWGTFYHTEDMNGDLIQKYDSGASGRPWSIPNAVEIQNTPLDRFGERLNYDLGIYAQDAWTIKRLTLNLGIRWDALNAEVLPATTRAGRFAPARAFEGIKDLPNWRDWAPRFAMVYDLFGNAKTAVKYSINRYNAARTTGIADDYNPLVDDTEELNWVDVNGDDIAQGQLGCNFGTNGLPGCEIDVNGLPANYGIAALNEYGRYPRTWNLEHGLELQHELLPRLSVTGSWFHGAFHNLTTTINRSYNADADYVPATIYDPFSGQPISEHVYFQRPSARGRATLNLDTFDPEREQIYNAFNISFTARPGRGANIFGGFGFERELQVNCTAPDNPNNRRFCDDRRNDIPFGKTLKVAGSYPLPWGIIFSGALQSNESPAATTVATTRNLTITRNVTRYPTNCPAPCPAGQIIAPSTLQGATTLNVLLVPTRDSRVERITQLDFKVQRTFRFGRVSVLPTFEVFNVNNSDAIISYQSVNALNAQYLAPNSIMQPRMIGVGATVRW